MNVFGWYGKEITEMLPNFLGWLLVGWFFFLFLYRDIWVPGVVVAIPSSDGVILAKQTKY